MRSLTICFAPLWMAILAAPALAVTPQQGDIFYTSTGSLYHLEASSGIETLVSCSDLAYCNPLIGSGPVPENGDINYPQVGADGWIYFHNSGATGTEAYYRIDPENGNREFVVAASLAPITGFAVYPAPNFFPSTVASLGGWGLAGTCQRR